MDARGDGARRCQPCVSLRSTVAPVAAGASRRDGRFQAIDVLFVCTANQCRSPLAEALFAAAVAARGRPLEVGSAGFLPGGRPVPPEMAKVTAGSEVDLTAHRSRRLDPELVSSASLVVTMTRQHLVDVILLAPGAWAHCFTLAEVLRRGRAAGPRRPGQPIADWVARVHAGRTRAGVLGLDLADDVEDPMGGRRSAFERTLGELRAATAELAALVAPPERRQGAAPSA